MKIYTITLKASIDRWQAMQSSFKKDKLIKINAVNGYDFADGTFNKLSQPNWDKEKRQELIEDKTLHPQSLLSPAEVGCNLSHKKAIKKFLGTKAKQAIILEDDVEPTGNGSLSKISFPSKKTDMLYLCSEDHPGKRFSLTKENQIYSSRTLMGYLINRKAANALLEAAEPMISLFDFQFSICSFKSLVQFNDKWGKRNYPITKDKIIASGLRTGGYIKHSKFAKRSTLTKTGLKSWLLPRMNII